MSLPLIPRVQHSLNLPISFVVVQPLPTHENSRHPVGRVCDLYAFKVPAGVRTRVVMLDTHPQQFPKVQHLQYEPICATAFKKVTELLLEGALARVSIDTVDGDKDVGVCSTSLDVARDDDDLILDGHQAAHLAGKALHALGALKRHEGILFGSKGDLSVTVKCISAYIEVDKTYE